MPLMHVVSFICASASSQETHDEEMGGGGGWVGGGRVGGAWVGGAAGGRLVTLGTAVNPAAGTEPVGVGVERVGAGSWEHRDDSSINPSLFPTLTAYQGEALSRTLTFQPSCWDIWNTMEARLSGAAYPNARSAHTHISEGGVVHVGRGVFTGFGVGCETVTAEVTITVITRGACVGRAPDVQAARTKQSTTIRKFSRMLPPSAVPSQRPGPRARVAPTGRQTDLGEQRDPVPPTYEKHPASTRRRVGRQVPCCSPGWIEWATKPRCKS